MSRYWKVTLIVLGLIAVGSILIGLVLDYFIISRFKDISISLSSLLHSQTWVITGLTFGIICVFYFMNDTGDYTKHLGKSRAVDVGLENSRLMTKQQVKENFTCIDFDQLSETASGIVVGAKESRNKKKLEIIMADAIHALVIGNTGGGKTVTFISANIQNLSCCKDKPSMIIADPKGELFDKHTKALKNRGYKVQVIDLINPMRSTRWNPLSSLYDKYQKMLECSDYIEKKEMEDDVNNTLTEIVQTIFKVNENVKDPMWDNGMQSLILAVLHGMLEDSQKVDKGMTKEKFNFGNMRTILTKTEKECQELKDWFATLDKHGQASTGSKTVLSTTDKTLQSYFTTIFNALNIFADIGVCTLMRDNEIDFSSFDEEATALFLKIPDERKSRHEIASAFFSITYKELVGKARENANSALKRPLYYIIDEFANLPKIPDIDKNLAVCRSRKIFYMLVLQSYEQLETVYGKATGDVIKGNCNIELFISSKESGTLESFSRKCGNYTVTSQSVSQSGGSGSSNTSVKEKPIYYPRELAELNNPPKVMGNTVVLMSGKKPMQSKYTPDFLCKHYELGGIELEINKSKIFDAKIDYYDISGVSQEVTDEMIALALESQVPTENPKSETVKSKNGYATSDSGKRLLLQYTTLNAVAISEMIRNCGYKELTNYINLAKTNAKEQKANGDVNILKKELTILANHMQRIEKEGANEQ